MNSTTDSAVVAGGAEDANDNDDIGDTVNLPASITTTITGLGGAVGLLGISEQITTSNETVSTLAKDTNEWAIGTGERSTRRQAGHDVINLFLTS